jgi:hypothetical protein
MNKLILHWSYRLGLASAVVALALRTVNAFGVWLPQIVVQGVTIWYMSFFKGALLFLLVSMAASLYGLARNAEIVVTKKEALPTKNWNPDVHVSDIHEVPERPEAAVLRLRKDRPNLH